MFDYLTIYFYMLALIVVGVMGWLAYESYKLGKVAPGKTQQFLYSLAGVRLSFIGLQLFWLILIAIPRLLPALAAWPYYRPLAVVLWTISQLIAAWAAYYSWRTLHRKE